MFVKELMWFFGSVYVFYKDVMNCLRGNIEYPKPATTYAIVFCRIRFNSLDSSSSILFVDP